jgi:Zn-dependent M28 family amino/carboxypeptidase
MISAFNSVFCRTICAGALFTSSLVQAAFLSEAEQQQLLELRAHSQSSSVSWDIEESLTTEVGARMVGTPGDQRAIAWAEQKMQALGFDKVWSEAVDYDAWYRGETHARIVAPYPQKMVAIALGGSVGTDEHGLEAEVVHFEDFAALKAAETGSLTGKIAFVSYRMERHKTGKGYGKAVGTRVNGASVAAEKGAVALIMRSVGTDNNRTGHTGVMRYKEGVNKIPAAALSNPDADLLVNQLKRGQPVRFYLNQSSRLVGKQGQTANVIGEITGSQHPEEIVVIGAHLDSWDVGTGAIDDGMGVSITLAAAHHIANLPQRPKRTIRVVLFAGEEVGLIGVKEYVKVHQDSLAQHMIGAEWDFGNGHIYQMKSGVGAQSLNAIRELAQYLAPLGVALHPENNGRAQSDMGLLTDQGMPSVNFAPDGSDYFDFHHTENDTLDKVNVSALKQATAVYTVFAYFAAQAEVDFRQ